MTPELDIDLELDTLAADAAPAPARDTVIFAFDRANRHIDLDGHMHVETTNISKANVCEYYGAEIPGGDEMGLEPSRLYKLYRDPAELEAGAKTFENKPLMFKHVAVLASAPQKYYVVGSVSNVRYSHPYLKASLAVWDGDAIREIETHEREQLSCGYRYRADMSPGTTVDGVKFDGIMRDIVGNHVALVEIGRAGPDVLVSDELPQGFEHMKKSLLIAALAPFMAADADMIAVDAAISKLATDAKRGKDSTPAEEPEANVEKNDKAAAQDEAAVEETVKGKDSKECAAEDEEMDDLVEDEGPSMTPDPKTTPKKDLKGNGAPSAMDEAVKAAVAANDALHLARREVESVLGSVALDSAAAVYKAGLDKLGVDSAGIDPSALRAVYQLATKKAAPALASDAAVAHKSTVEAFNLGRFQ